MAMERSWHVVFPAGPDAVPEAADWLAACLAGGNLPDRLLFRLNLCVEELLMNTIRHGMRSGGGLVASIRLDLFPDRMLLVYEDNGHPFDVTKAPARRLDRPLAEITPGGLGVELVRRFSDEFAYQQAGSGNRVTCVFFRGRE